MQDRKLPVSSQSKKANPSELKRTPTVVVSNRDNTKIKSLRMLSLIASLSSLGATVYFHQPAQAKTTTSRQQNRMLIAELPPLEIANSEKKSQQVLVDAPIIQQPASKILLQSNLPQTTTVESIPKLPALELVPRQQQEASQTVHTVKAGETIIGIASQYGVPSSQIIKANQLNNPHFIKVNHQLIIPTVELAQETDYQRIETVSDREYSLSNSVTIANSTKPTSLSSLAEKKAESGKKKQSLESIVKDSQEKNNIEQNSNSTVAQGGSDPYISRLRQDIVELRTRYRDQNGDSEFVNTPSTTVPSTTEAREKTATNTAAEIIIPVPTPNSTGVVESDEERKPITNSAPGTQSVSSASTLTENADNLISLSGTNTVTPDLPPLSSPEEYLPDDPVFDGYIWPAQGTLTSGYGWRWGRMHKGIDIAAPIGTPIMAAASGEVIFAGWNSGGYGNLVKLRHSDGSVTYYAHNNRVLVSNGQRVKQGQLIAEMGSTGRSTGPHLHFEIRPNGLTAINPIARLPKVR